MYQSDYMKKLIVIALFLLGMADAAFAQIRRGAMQVKLRDGKMLTIILDGRHFRRYGSSIAITDLPQGMHDLKVYHFYPANDRGYKTFKDNRSHAVLIHKGRIQVNGGSMYYCTVDPMYKTLSFRESRTVYIDDNENSYPINTETVFSDEKDNTSFADDENWDDRKRNDRSNVVSYYRDDNRLTASQMATLKTAVEDRMGTDDKVALIKNYISNKAVMTDQVMTMMGWLSFESSKLEVAKAAYPKVLDKENYLEVSRILSFQNSKRELEDIIFAQKNRRNRNVNDDWTDEDDIYDYDKREQIARPAEKPKLEILQADEMTLLSKSVADKMRDSDKQKLLTQYLENRKLLTTQLSVMLDWLTFEGSRLEFSKWSFNKITDKENFTQIKSKFRFISSKKSIDELAPKTN